MTSLQKIGLWIGVFIVIMFVMIKPASAGFLAPTSQACGAVPSICRATLTEAQQDYISNSWPWPAVNPITSQCGVFTLVGTPTWSGSTVNFIYTSAWAPAAPNNTVAGSHSIQTCEFISPTCPAGQSYDTTVSACVANMVCTNTVYNQPSGTPQMSICIGSSGGRTGCLAVYEQTRNYTTMAVGDGHLLLRISGISCVDNSSQCPAGQSSGTVNGVDVCVPSASNNSTPVYPFSTPPASSVTAAKSLQDAIATSAVAAAKTAAETAATQAGATVSEVQAAGTAAAAQAAATNCTINPLASGCSQSQTSGAVNAPAVAGLYNGDLNATGHKTVTDVVNTFKGRITGSQVGSAVSGFFNVSIAGGTCPVWTTNAPMIGTITFDIYCRPMFQEMLPWIKSIILIIFSFVAFRIAIL